MTDRDIILQVLAGDAEAFALLVDRHYDRCARVAFRILGNREDAEEAIQDAFLRAYRALGSYENREHFSAWLTRILINQCRSVLSKVRRSEALFIELEPGLMGGFAAQEADDGSWPDLERALARLPADQREAIVLRFADDLTYEQMARVTGAGESALKMRVQRAFARLRALLPEVSRV
ncbi:MAG: RNA polymerase sigma factor [bacterium]